MKEVFLHYQYTTQFRRRAGWRMLPFAETRFTMSEVYEWRALAVVAVGDPSDLAKIESDYRFDISWGRNKHSTTLVPIQTALRETHSRVLTIPITPAQRFKKRQKITVRMSGKPFKLSARIGVQVLLEGVQVHQLKKQSSGTDISDSPDSGKGKGGAK